MKTKLIISLILLMGILFYLFNGSSVIKSSFNDAGDRRFIRVQFDPNHSNFSGFNNWKIIDLESDVSVVTFDKQTSSLLDLGWFKPGEGKLYKIVPL